MPGLLLFSYFLILTELLLCTLPGRRPGTAEGSERARPGRVLVFFLHFSPCTYKVRQIKLHLNFTTVLILLLYMITTNVYFDWLQLATGIWSAPVHIGSGKWKTLFGATYWTTGYYSLCTLPGQCRAPPKAVNGRGQAGCSYFFCTFSPAHIRSDK